MATKIKPSNLDFTTLNIAVSNTGNVGIGTASPADRLHVSGGRVSINAGDSIEDALVIGAGTSGTTGENRSVLILANSSTSKGLQFKATNAVQRIVALNSGGAGVLTFGNSSDTGATFNEHMRIDSSGKVGIGMTPTGTLSIRPSGTGSEDSHIGYGANLDTYITTGSDGVVIFREGDGAGINTERMRIDASGNVGIGNTAPTAKLHVSGNTIVTGVLTVDQGITTTTNDLYIESDSGSLAADSQIRFRTDGVNRMILNNDRLYLGDNLYLGRLRDVATDSYNGGEVVIVLYGDLGGGRTIIRSPSGTDPDKTMFICDSDVSTYRGTGYVAGTYNDVFRVDQSGGIQGSYHWAGRTENDSSSPVSTFFVGELGFQAYAYNSTTVTTTDPSTGASGGQAYVIARHTADTSPVFYSIVAGTVRFQSLANGTLNYSGTLAQLSDATFKTDITPANRQWDDIKALNIVNFRWADPNEDQKLRIGVIAQEVEAAGMPGLVDESYHPNPEYDGRKDPPEKKWLYLEDGVTKKSHKTVKTDVMLYKTIKALQEAMTRIEELETQVAALRSDNP